MELVEVDLTSLKSPNLEDEEKKRLEDFIRIGFSLFSTTFDEYKKDNVPSSSDATNVIANTAGGMAAGLTIFTLGGTGATAARSQVKSMVEKSCNYFSSEKYKQERDCILTWTNFLGNNEKQFLFAVAKGLAYICMAFKDQIKMFPKNDTNNKNFFGDVFRRVLKYMKENPRDKESTMSAEEFFLAFITGRSTPQGKMEQMKSLKVKRGLPLFGFNREDLNTEDLFQNCGHIVCEEGNERFTLFVYRGKNSDQHKLSQFRFKYDFEESNAKSSPTIALNENNPIYDEMRQSDWRLCPNIVKNYIDKNFKRIVLNLNNTSKWFPKELYLPNAFLRRKDGNVSLAEQMNKHLLDEENDASFVKNFLTLTGIGGVGKSTTVKWFAREFQDNYDQIIWIDCGENSTIVNSFKSLARFLKVESAKEMEISELSINCFDRLKDFNCLWIYDNAECYVGENGIHDVLPEKYENFQVIITSRNRDWGNVSGLGKIRQISLETFDKKEALEFVQNNLNDFSHGKKIKIDKLCELLGYLPLAIQIALAALKDKKITLEKYITKIKMQDQIIHDTVDTYDGTVNKAMEISLEIMKKHNQEGGELACRILSIFAYITSNDVDNKFFCAMENQPIEIIEEATELLEKYSLITFNQNHSTLSIHPLLQKVIRQNEKDKRSKILTKILKCEGFLDYKLIPFGFADELLKNEFPQLESELVDKLILKKLLREQRFQEAVDLALLIKEKWKDLSSTYNYAYCVKQNGDTEESKLLFENLYEKVHRIELKLGSSEKFFQLGVISSTDILHGKLVGGQLMLIHLEDGNIEKFGEILKTSGGVFECDPKNLNSSIKFLSVIPNCLINYNGNLNYFSATALGNMAGKKIQLSNCLVDEETFSSSLSDFQELNLNSVQMSSNVFSIISSELNRIQKLKLKNMDVELSRDLTVDELHLENVTVLDWNKAKWNINKLFIGKVDFVEKNEMQIKELVIKDSEIDISVLPPHLEKLYLSNSICINCEFSENSVNLGLPKSLLDFSLKTVKFRDTRGNELNQVDLSPSIFSGLSRLNKLLLDCLALSAENSLTVSLDCLHFIENLHLLGCNVLLNATSELRISPKALTLMDITVIGESDARAIEGKPFSVYQFVDFSQLKETKLCRTTTDLNSEEIIMDSVHLVEPITILHWKNSKWNTEKLILSHVPFVEKTQMTVREIEIHGSWNTPMDISLLSGFQGLTKLELHRTFFVTHSKHSFQTLQNLETLIMHDVQFSRSVKKVNISPLILPSLKIIKLCFKNTKAKIKISQKCLSCIQFLELSYCKISCKGKNKITPIELKLDNVEIQGNDEIRCCFSNRTNEKILINRFVDFTQMQKLWLSANPFALDMSSDNISVDEVFLSDNIIRWDSKIQWAINKLSLYNAQSNLPLFSTDICPSVASVHYIMD